MENLVKVVLLSKAGEDQSQFNKRLIAFWTRILRTWPDEYELVYAESAEFERQGSRLARSYLAEDTIADLLEREFATEGIDHEAIDRDDLYSRFEATPPEWFQIPH